MKTAWAKRVIAAMIMLSLALGPQLAEACSRILWETSLGTYVGRGEDWFEPATETTLGGP